MTGSNPAPTPTWPFERWLAPQEVPTVGPRSAMRAPLLGAVLSAAASCVAAALVAGAASGAAAGTLIVPIFGTIYGGAAGAAIGACVGAVYTPIMLVVLIARHRHPISVYAPLNDLVRAFSVLVTVLSFGLALVALLTVFSGPIGDVHPLGIGWVVGVGIAAIAVVIRVLRKAVVAICRAWSEPWGVKEASR